MNKIRFLNIFLHLAVYKAVVKLYFSAVLRISFYRSPIENQDFKLFLSIYSYCSRNFQYWRSFLIMAYYLSINT